MDVTCNSHSKLSYSWYFGLMVNGDTQTILPCSLVAANLLYSRCGACYFFFCIRRRKPTSATATSTMWASCVETHCWAFISIYFLSFFLLLCAGESNAVWVYPYKCHAHGISPLPIKHNQLLQLLLIHILWSGWAHTKGVKFSASNQSTTTKSPDPIMMMEHRSFRWKYLVSCWIKWMCE